MGFELGKSEYVVSSFVLIVVGGVTSVILFFAMPVMVIMNDAVIVTTQIEPIGEIDV